MGKASGTVVLAVMVPLLTVVTPGVAEGAARCAPQLVAHRGLTAGTFENTMPGFRAALAAGARILEADVRFSADHVPVLMHDPTVDRTTDGSGTVAAMTYADLRQLDAGGGASVPRLEALVGLADRRGARLLLEVKDVDLTERHARTVVDAVRSRGLLPRTVVSSFRPENLEVVRRLAPDVTTGLLFMRSAPPVETVAGNGAVALPERRLVTRREVRRWHAAGLASFTWTLNRRTAWAAARTAGVDAVITDRPERYARWARRQC